MKSHKCAVEFFPRSLNSKKSVSTSGPILNSQLKLTVSFGFTAKAPKDRIRNS